MGRSPHLQPVLVIIWRAGAGGAGARAGGAGAAAGQLDPGPDTELGEDLVQVVVDGARAEEQLGRDFPDTGAVSPAELRAGQLLWATVDSPWVHTVDPAKYAASFQTVREFGPSVVLSTHLPPVKGNVNGLFRTMLDAPQADVFTGPDQAALEAVLRGFEPAARLTAARARWPGRRRAADRRGRCAGPACGATPCAASRRAVRSHTPPGCPRRWPLTSAWTSPECGPGAPSRPC